MLLIILLVFHIVIYFTCFYLVWKRKEYQEISVRSPFLLTMNNIGGFLMTGTFLIYELMEKYNSEHLLTFCHILPYNYIIFHLLMITSFYLRCHRIIISCNINKNENIEDFKMRRDLFTERFYVKVLIFITICFTILFYFINYEISIKNTSIIVIPRHFDKCIVDPNEEVIKDFHDFIYFFWLILGFIECFILITYTYFIYYSQINKSIKFELFSFSLIWIASLNYMSIIDLTYFVDSNINHKDHLIHVVSLIFITLIVLCLIATTIIPLVYSFFQSSNFNLHFPTKILNNFFMFMTNPYCFKEFLKYLMLENNSNILLYLDFYVDTISLRLKLNIKNEYNISDVQNLYNFIQRNDDLFTLEIRSKINSNYHNFNKHEIEIELFDEAFCFSYEMLESKFSEFKTSKEYSHLVHKVKLHSDIFCRMYNTGLIRKN